MSDIDKTKEQLIDELGHLRQQVSQLKELENERRRTQEMLQQRTHDLSERVKELNCVYAISNLSAKPGISLEEILGRTVDLIPLAWQYPEIACARITFGNKEFRSDNFETTQWGQSANIYVHGQKEGTVEVYYLEASPDLDEGPFLEQERLLIDDVADRLGEIAERKQAEVALQESEKKYRVLAESLFDAVYGFNLEGKFLYTNEAASHMFGYSKEEILGSVQVDGIIEGEDLIASRKDINRISKGETVVAERTFIRKDGTKFVGEVHSGPIYEGKDVVGVRGVLRDITKRKRMEEALRESERKYKELAESISDVFFAFNQELRYTYWNKASEELTGISAKNALGKHLYDLFPDAEMTRRAVKVYLKALRTKQPQHFVNEYELGGKDYSFEISAYPTKNGLSVFVRDITKRKRLEEALRKAKDELEMRVRERTAELESLNKDLYNQVTERKRAEEALTEAEEKYRALFEQELDGVVVIDETIRLLLANEAAAEMFGFDSVEELLEANLFDYIPPEERDRVLTIITKDMFEKDLRQVNEFRCTKKSGEEIWIGAVGTRIEYQGKAASLASFRDITERKKAEDERRALSRRLVEIQEDERRAIARELHDQIGQSLTGLKLLLATAMRSPAEDVGSILREAKALVNELMSQVRTFSLELGPSMLDDLGLLAALVWHFERYTARTHVRVNFQHAGLDRRFPLAIRTAAYRIVQEALTNVARHAGVSEVRVRVWAIKNTLFVLIEDQGTGFEPAKLSVSGSSGLNGMRERTLLLGGKLTVESAPGVGTSVTAELPLPHLSKNRKEERQG